MRIIWVSGDNASQLVQYGDEKTVQYQVTTFTKEDMCIAGRNVQFQFHLSSGEGGGELMQVYHDILVGQDRLPSIGDIAAFVVSSSMQVLRWYHLEEV
ncbi:putative general transcription factor IIE subunit 1 [Iris pallida]|uniref:General transcription factor IIE subunit 1 n=1 Tax=Iris pallida TaxID=29817 RepID=A0AAX6H3D0_IRIPA|nr:putative general transcription factor IIE subunit 1 [Iris pallida]KAJ6835539.1 putative general transcription factor IIE subunit 1 [Iris pallida]